MYYFEAKFEDGTHIRAENISKKYAISLYKKALKRYFVFACWAVMENT